jgi:hypothetical protein
MKYVENFQLSHQKCQNDILWVFRSHQNYQN